MEIVNIRLADNSDTYQNYDDRDVSLISTARISRPFGLQQDYVEYFIYDSADRLLSTNYFTDSYTLSLVDPVTGLSTGIELDPEGDVRKAGYDRGSVTIQYNFFRKLFRSSVTETFWIKEISVDRTEIRICRQDLSNQDLQQAFTDYNLQISTKAYYPDFYLNFGDNRLLIAVNVLYALQDEQGSLLIKLYEPLPDDVVLKDTLWIVDKLSDQISYEVTIDVPVEEVLQTNSLRGPNYNVDLIEKINQTTPAYNYATLFQTSISASYQQLRSIMEEKGLDINVDYSDFSNFAHFSSVTDRISNFAYKVGLIEQYQADINNLQTVTGNTTLLSGSKVVLQSKIDNVVEKFDGYEYYLYFESSSTAWPKSNTTKPYTLYSVTSSEAINWLGSTTTTPSAGTASVLFSASLYDIDNKDAIVNTIPEYLKQDNSNLPYRTFLNMVAQHFDNIWIYLKDVTERYDADNSLDRGISKDLVGDALRALGIKLYTNTSISDNIYYSMLAINPDGSTTPPTGSEIIKYYIPYAANGLYVVSEYVDPDYMETFSAGETIPGDDITKGNYKRLYHNVPYLLKTKGTQRGLRALINCFGIPDTILRINEYGGSDKSAATPDLVQKRHSLAYYNTGSATLRLPWVGQNYYFVSASNKNVVPDTIEFRFKATGLPDSTHTSQSIFQVGNGSATQFGINLVYNSGSAIPSSSYQYYGNLRLFLSGSNGYTKTSPIYLPFYDPTLWWNIMIKRETGSGQVQSNSTSNRYWIYAKSTAYNEESNANITFEGSQSIYIDGATSPSYNGSWNTFNTSSYQNMFRAYLGGTGSNSVLSPDNTFFQGYFQEFRYWATPLTETAFDEHVINSTSYRGNTVTASLYDLTFRLPLGSNLNVPYLDISDSQVNLKDYDLYELGITNISDSASLSSYHPLTTGSFILPFSTLPVTAVPSFISGSTTFSYGLFGGINPKYFQPYEVVDLIPTPATGIGQKVNNKVTVVEDDNLAENVLSPFVSIQRYNQDISKNSTDLEVGFSPSDVLDLDISNQLGYFNIDDYIGSPTDAYSDNYSDLDTLRQTYFQKYTGQNVTPYTSQYNVKDFIRLIKYYDNSLFKMIKDFVPARANVATGIIVKPNILNRPKYPRHEPIVTQDNNYTGSINMVSISGSNPEDQYLNTSYTTYLTTKLGTVTQSRTDLREAFTGEFKGSEVEVTDGYFPQTEVSSILQPFTSSVQGALAIYTTYSIDPLENNTEADLRSTRFLQVDYSSNVNVPVNLGIITGALALYESRSNDPGSNVLTSSTWPFASVNDYNWRTYSRLSLRYEGSKTISQKYNVYSPATGSWEGDKSYGKTAAVDRNSYKLGWVKNIAAQSLNFRDKTQIQLKYLVDKDLNVTDLSLKNDNLFEVQNTFKSGDPVVISLSDPLSPSFQKTLDGTKTIFRGGYSYDPILYREQKEPLYIKTDSATAASSFLGYKASATNFYSYKNSSRALCNLASGVHNYDPGTSYIGLPYGTPVGIGEIGYNFTKNYGGWKTTSTGQVETNAMVSQDNTRNITSFNNVYPELAAKQQTQFPAPSWTGYGIANSLYESTNGQSYELILSDPGSITYMPFTSNINNGFTNGNTLDNFTDNGSYLFKATSPGVYTLSGNIPLFMRMSYPKWHYYGISTEYNHPFHIHGAKFKVVAVIEKSNTPNNPGSWTYVASTRLKNVYTPDGGFTYNENSNEFAINKNLGGGAITGLFLLSDANLYLYRIGFNLTFQDDDTTAANRDEINVNLGVGDVLRLKLFLFDPDNFFNWGRDMLFDIGKPNTYTSLTPNYTPTFAGFNQDDLNRFSEPAFTIVDKTNPITNYSNIVEYTDTDVFTSTGNNEILFTPSMSVYLTPNSIFYPSSSVGTDDYYSPVLDPLNLQPQDLLRIGSFKSTAPEYYVITDTKDYYLTENGVPFGARVAFADSFNFNSSDIPTEYRYLGLRSVIWFPTALLNNNGYPESSLLPGIFTSIFNSPAKSFTVGNMNARNGISPATVFSIRDVVTCNYRIGTFIATTNYSMCFVIISDDLRVSSNPKSFNSTYKKWGRSLNTSTPELENATTGVEQEYGSSTDPLPQFYPQVTSQPYIKAVLDRAIAGTALVPLSQISQNFAILRPRPDETSVIVNYEKQPGEVSQTVLIPQDASDELKNNVGTIFQNLNTDLANQNTTY